MGRVNKLENIVCNYGINPNEEVSQLFRDECYPESYDPTEKFRDERKARNDFIHILMEKKLIDHDISNFNVVEIGGGTCCTGAAFADRCNTVISFELEKVHCLYAKKCREHFNIGNLGIFYGSISDAYDHVRYSMNPDTADLFVSHMGMFKFTVFETMERAVRILRKTGTFVCVYPRFWTHSDGLNDADGKLLKRALDRNTDWGKFFGQLKDKLDDLGFKIEHNDILNEYNQIPIGGDVILGSNIASGKEEYFNNPIEGIAFGKTLITCNTLVCTKI